MSEPTRRKIDFKSEKSRTGLDVKRVVGARGERPSNIEEMNDVHPKSIQLLLQETAACETVYRKIPENGAVLCQTTEE